jgi:predicted methyltransferase
MANKPLSAGARPSQDFVPIEQVRDGMLVLRDGSIRAVLMTSSINIVLKSEDEQAAILGQFKNYLNSLDFTIQIFIQSRELDIRPYLALLEDAYRTQQTDLMKIQVREYIDFVRSFVDGASIMTKSFYIVIPYSPPVMVNSENGIRSILGSTNSNSAQISREVFEEYRSQMEQRVSTVVNGLARTGVRAVQLGTEEVIELFYRLFNIGELDRPIPLKDLSNL